MPMPMALYYGYALFSFRLLGLFVSLFCHYFPSFLYLPLFAFFSSPPRFSVTGIDIASEFLWRDAEHDRVGGCHTGRQAASHRRFLRTSFPGIRKTDKTVLGGSPVRQTCLPPRLRNPLPLRERRIPESRFVPATSIIVMFQLHSSCYHFFHFFFAFSFLPSFFFSLFILFSLRYISL